MRRIAFILAVLIFSSSIAACGQKGALKLPQETPAPVPKASTSESNK